MTVMNSVTKYHQTYHSPLPYDYHKQGSKKLFSSVIPFEMFCESAYCFAVWIRNKKCKILFCLLNCLYFTPFPLAKESTIYQVPIPLFLPLWRKLFSLTKTSVWQTNFSVTDFVWDRNVCYMTENWKKLVSGMQTCFLKETVKKQFFCYINLLMWQKLFFVKNTLFLGILYVILTISFHEKLEVPLSRIIKVITLVEPWS